MPRDGSGNYRQPFPEVEEDTTIESAIYNGFTADVAIDLNTPRPVMAGGTGAANTRDAAINLGYESGKQLVTNYDSHPWLPGSFYSLGVINDGAPVSGHKFVGTSYLSEDGFVLEARDQSDTVVPGRVYVREKKPGGSWSTWKIQGPLISTGIEGTPSETGDMFYGIRGATPDSRFVVNPESDGSGVDVMAVTRTGVVNTSGALNVAGAITTPADITGKDLMSSRAPTEGVVFLGSDKAHYLHYRADIGYSAPSAPLTLGAEPTADSHAATKKYVDHAPRILTLNATTQHTYINASHVGTIQAIANGAASYFIVQTQASAPMPNGIGSQIDLINWGCPDCRVYAAPGVSLYSEDQRFRLRTTWSTATLIHLGSDSWLVTGSLIP